MEPIKIHPFDVYKMLNKRLATLDMVIDYRLDKEGKELPENQLIIDGILYEQTTEVPASEEALRIIG